MAVVLWAAAAAACAVAWWQFNGEAATAPAPAASAGLIASSALVFPQAQPPKQPQQPRPQVLQPQTLQPQTLQPQQPLPQTLQPQTLQPQTLQPQTLQPHALGSIQSEHGRLRIDISAMPLAQAARLLAAATNATLHGAQALDESTVRLTMKWRGQLAASAWQHLLGFDANYAVRCGDHACTVWLAGGPLPGRAMQAGGATLIAPPLMATQQTDPPGLFPPEG